MLKNTLDGPIDNRNRTNEKPNEERKHSENAVKAIGPGSRMKNARFLEILDIVCENVAPEWKAVGKALGLSPRDIHAIEHNDSNHSLDDRCWAMLCRWCEASRKMAPSRDQSRDLVAALECCHQRRVADIMSRMLLSEESVEEVLALHLEREGRVTDAMYAVSDMASKHWRLLATKLGLQASEISRIEGSAVGRSREKCMRALYRWRAMVPLQEFKVGNLILALRECGLQDEAGELNKLLSVGTKMYSRKKRKGEVLIHIEMQNLVPKQAKSHRTSKGSRRPLNLMSQHTLQQYALNRIFIQLLDDLEAQDRTTTHDLVTYFYSLNQSLLSEVSRGGRYMAVRCPGKGEQIQILELADSGELTEKFNSVLVSEGMMVELGVEKLRLNCVVFESELATPRTEGSLASRSTPNPSLQVV